MANFFLIWEITTFVFRDALAGLYADLKRLGEDVTATTTIRQKTFQEIQKSLDGINTILKCAGKLRGRYIINIIKFNEKY